MSETVLLQLSGILVFGVVAQWLAWMLRIPSIVFLLMIGVFAGPVTGFLKPDELFGALLLPFVSLCVGVILYEGGLNLRLSELRNLGGVFTRLILFGSLFSWAFTAAAAHYLLGLSWAVSLLMGAILIVTGPTVIGPILRNVRIRGPAAALLKWEGIVIDPLGAILAVLVFTGVGAANLNEGVADVARDFAYLIGSGLVFGVAAAFALIYALKTYRVPDYLHNPFSLMLMAASFTGSTFVQHESGLLAVTIMGMIIANQRRVPIKHILEFKEAITVLLISTLFILLAARLTMDDLRALGWRDFLFVLSLLALGRPLSVLLSTFGKSLKWNERIFLMAMAPRGIVAAAVTSVFAITMVDAGYAEANHMISATFLLVFVSVLVYGIASRPLANRLHLSGENPQGVIFVGAHEWGREIAQALAKAGIAVLLIDRNRVNASAARMMGLTVQIGDALDEHLIEELNISPYARLIALTPNDELNSLICLRFTEEFGRNEVYQLPFSLDRGAKAGVSLDHRGRFFPSDRHTYSVLDALFEQGYRVKVNKITEQFDLPKLVASYEGEVVPLFVLKAVGTLEVFTADARPVVEPGDRVLSLVRGGATDGQKPENAPSN